MTRVRRLGTLLVTATAMLVATAASAPAATVFQTDYTSGFGGWNGVQQAAGTERITRAAAPGSPLDPHRPPNGTTVMRVELHPGDVASSGNRAEVYGRNGSPWSSTPPERWPDPAGSERWYDFAFYLPEDWQTATDTTWLDLTQWKGYRGGSPPVALEIKRDRLNLGGKRIRRDLGRIKRGGWTRVTFGIKFMTTSDGWVEVYRDGVQYVPRTPLATMDTYNGQPDPTYLKQGIYRSASWTHVHVAYFGPMTVTDSRPTGQPQPPVTRPVTPPAKPPVGPPSRPPAPPSRPPSPGSGTRTTTVPPAPRSGPGDRGRSAGTPRAAATGLIQQIRSQGAVLKARSGRVLFTVSNPTAHAATVRGVVKRPSRGGALSGRVAAGRARQSLRIRGTRRLKRAARGKRSLRIKLALTVTPDSGPPVRRTLSLRVRISR